MAWPGEGEEEKPKDRTADRRRIAVDVASRLIDRYVLGDHGGKEAMDEAHFVSLARLDADLSKDLREWTAECEQVEERTY